MTREEFGIIVKALKSVYTSPSFIPDADAFNVWFEMFKDVEYKILNYSARQYMLTGKYPPTIADLREIATNFLKKSDMPELEAWAIVSEAIRDSAYHAQERFDAFPEPIKKAVGSASNLRAWGMSTDYNESVTQSHFIRAYKSVLQREKGISVLTPELKRIVNEKERRDLSAYEPKGIEERADN